MNRTNASSVVDTKIDARKQSGTNQRQIADVLNNLHWNGLADRCCSLPAVSTFLESQSVFMRDSIVVAIMFALTSFSSLTLADETKNADTPSSVAIDFVATLFIKREVDRVADFCQADAKRHRKLDDGVTVAEYLKKTISKIPDGDDLRLKHFHVFRKSDITASFLKSVMPIVAESDLVDSFKPFTDAMQEGFCCVVVFDIARGSEVRPYMFTFAFTPVGKSYKLSLMDEGVPR